MSSLAPDLFLSEMDLAINALHAATALYTHDPVVTDLLDRLDWPACGGRLLDPGAGDGAFLLAAVARIDIPCDDVGALYDRVEAWEIHEEAASTCRRRLAHHLIERGWSEKKAGVAASMVVVHEDFLIGPGPTRRFKIIAGNPPYLRYTNLPPLFKFAYSHLPSYARSDLLHAFLERSSAVVEVGGKIGMVTSDRWLGNSQAAALREHLGTRLSITYLRRLQSASTYYRPKDRRQGTPPRVHPVQIILAADTAGGLDPQEIILPTAQKSDNVTLGQVATIYCSPWLGPKGVFLLSHSEAQAAGISLQDLVPIAIIPRACDIVPPPSLFAIRTTRDAVPSPAVLSHLLRTMSAMPWRGHKAQKGCQWAPPEPWSKLPLPHDALVMPRIVSRSRILTLPAGHIPIGHNLVIDIRPEYRRELSTFLASDVAWRRLSATCPALENGYRQISAGRLRDLEIPISPNGPKQKGA